MRTLVIAEHDKAQLASATLGAITAASRFGGEVDVLVAGDACDAVVAHASTVQFVTRVLKAEASYYGDGTAENIAALVQRLASGGAYRAVLAGASSFGKGLTPRVAALLDVAPLSEVIAIEAPGRYRRPIYAGNVIVTVESDQPVDVLTVRGTAFDAAADGVGSAAVERIEAAEDQGLARVTGREISKSERPELGSAAIVVSGGRGLGSGENYKRLLEPLADTLGAALGASRAAVDAGFVPNDYQVGQTGKIVAPALYIAVGISGAIQHLAGRRIPR